MDGSGLTLADRCTGRWKSILPALGIHPSFLTGKNGPCPICGGRDRWRFIDHDGSGDWWCNTCDPQHGSGTQLVMAFLKIDFKRAAEAVEAVLGETRYKPPEKPKPWKQRDLMRSAWRSARPLSEDGPEGIYFRSRRLEFPPLKVLKFSEDVRYDETRRHPAILAAVVDRAGDPVNIHRMFITMEGLKTELRPARKLMWGKAPAGAAIRLFPLVDAMLGVAEGVETALAAAQIFQIPVWALICANGMAEFIPPKEISHLVIFGDNDASYTGQAAAYTLARRAVCDLKISAHVELPVRRNTDFNDDLFPVELAA